MPLRTDQRITHVAAARWGEGAGKRAGTGMALWPDHGLTPECSFIRPAPQAPAGPPIKGGARDGGLVNRPPERLPPGQYVPRGWPVLHYGPVPRFRPKSWDFRVFGATETGEEYRWSWAEFDRL